MHQLLQEDVAAATQGSLSVAGLEGIRVMKILHKLTVESFPISNSFVSDGFRTSGPLCSIWRSGCFSSDKRASMEDYGLRLIAYAEKCTKSYLISQLVLFRKRFL